MPARRIPPTRHSLLRITEQLETATWGLKILERRRQSLVDLAMWLLGRWQRQNHRLDEAFGYAREVRNAALEYEGIVSLTSAGMARRNHVELLFFTQQLQGLPVPFLLSGRIGTRLDERGYGLLGTSAATDEVASSHEDVLSLVVQQAELGLTLRILFAEIRRLNVRVNALRHKLVPELEARKASIEFHLAEREREERLVQRFFKRKRESKRDPGDVDDA